MKRIAIDILFLLLIVTHLIGQVVLLGDFSIDDLALATHLEATKDTMSHQQIIQQMKNIIKKGDEHSLKGILTAQRSYPPLFYYPIAVFLASFSFDKEYYVIRCSVLLFSVLIFLLLYGYFRKKGDPLTGIWAVSLTACCPFFLDYSTATTPHMFVVLCVLFLFILSKKTDNFHQRGWSLFFGFMSGLCLFAKDDVLIYCFVIYLISAIPIIIKPTRQQIRNLVFSLCLFGNFFAYFFYFYIYHDIVKGDLIYQFIRNEPEVIGSAALFSFPSFSFYGRMLYEFLVGPYVIGIICFATIIHFIRPRLYRERNVIFFCIIAIMIFTAIPHKNPEYISPLIPLMAILCARGISAIRFRIIQGVMIVAVCYLTVSAYMPPLLCNSLSARDVTQFEFAKAWDMVEEHIGYTSKKISVPVLGVSDGIVFYLSLKSYEKDYNIEPYLLAVSFAYPLEYINNFPKAPFFIYVSYSEKKRWPTQEELWDKFKQIHLADSNVVLQDWQKVVDSKDLFIEVASAQMILDAKKVHVFLYENRERLKEKEL
ncbi:ArnT family glycosyltransferase [Candidatus Omnitrophota bacterium]